MARVRNAKLPIEHRDVWNVGSQYQPVDVWNYCAELRRKTVALDAIQSIRDIGWAKANRIK